MVKSGINETGGLKWFDAKNEVPNKIKIAKKCVMVANTDKWFYGKNAVPNKNCVIQSSTDKIAKKYLM